MNRSMKWTILLITLVVSGCAERQLRMTFTPQPLVRNTERPAWVAEWRIEHCGRGVDCTEEELAEKFRREDAKAHQRELVHRRNVQAGAVALDRAADTNNISVRQVELAEKRKAGIAAARMQSSDAAIEHQRQLERETRDAEWAIQEAQHAAELDLRMREMELEQRRRQIEDEAAAIDQARQQLLRGKDPVVVDCSKPENVNDPTCAALEAGAVKY